jgi:hypothetical protein
MLTRSSWAKKLLFLHIFKDFKIKNLRNFDKRKNSKRRINLIWR